MPAMIEFGSSWAAEFTVSLAPITKARSVSEKERQLNCRIKNASGPEKVNFLSQGFLTLHQRRFSVPWRCAVMCDALGIAGELHG